VKAGLPQLADQLRALHRRGDPVVLPNAWDAASAKAVVAAGFRAVATTSAGVAESLGYADHQLAPPGEMFAAIARISRVVEVPVTADVEAGYGLAPAELVERLLEAGAVGCNLEDTDHAAHALRDADAHAKFLSEVVSAAKKHGVNLVLNARTDAFILGNGSEDEQVAESVRRGRLYYAAGAACVYPILARSERALAALAQQLEGALNGMLMPSAPPLKRLRELGYARVSAGPGLYRGAMAELKRRLEEIRSA
jgi:2-methylisocitrate lyase-like PEP mutase family enzyme